MHESDAKRTTACAIGSTFALVVPLLYRETSSAIRRW